MSIPVKTRVPLLADLLYALTSLSKCRLRLLMLPEAPSIRRKIDEAARELAEIMNEADGDSLS